MCFYGSFLEGWLKSIVLGFKKILKASLRFLRLVHGFFEAGSRVLTLVRCHAGPLCAVTWRLVSGLRKGGPRVTSTPLSALYSLGRIKTFWSLV